MAELRVPGDGSGGVSIMIPEREHRDSSREGWLDAEVVVKLGAWSTRYSAHFHENDFLPFSEGLAELRATLTGEATLSSLDGYLDITLTGDGLGLISVMGEAWDRPRVGPHLVFSYESDQTALPPLQDSLAYLAAYLNRTR